MENHSATKEIIGRYFEAVNNKGDWPSLISEKMTFTSSGKITRGKKEYIESLTRFLQVVESLKLNEFITQDNKACVTVEYHLKSPSGKTLNCEIAEILTVENNRICSSCIFFDTAAFHKFMEQN